MKRPMTHRFGLPGFRGMQLKEYLHAKWGWPAEGLRNPHGGRWQWSGAKVRRTVTA